MMKHSKSVISRIVKGFSAEKIKSLYSLSQGNINTVYSVRLASDKEIILRVYNEAWKAKKEAFIYRMVRQKLEIPVPEVLYSDDSKEEFPFAYSIMGKLPGKQIDRIYGRKNIFEKAGECLGKLHTIHFGKFGWIVGNDVQPAFRKWKDFFWHDINRKIERIREGIPQELPKIRRYFEENSGLLEISSKPCLLHKDYHPSHILAGKGKITGILDMEWAIAGHNENDFMKMEAWAFPKHPRMRKPFFRGYSRYSSISSEYEERKKFYGLWHRINMVSISAEIKNPIWLKQNRLALARFFT